MQLDEDVNSNEQLTNDDQSDQPAMSVSDFNKQLKKSVRDGLISKSQLQQIRSARGITQSEFTKKPYNFNKAKKKRKMQKQSRKVTLQKGVRGQKVTKGKKITTNY